MSFLEDFEPALSLVQLHHTARNFSDVLINHVAQSLSSTSCGGEEKEDAVGSCRDENLALHLKMGAIAAILVAGIVGVSFPLIGKKRRILRTNSALFVLFKAFAAGVILATGFVHMLPDGQEALTNSCLPKSPWSNFPFSGFVAMLSALGTLVMDFIGTQYYEGKNRREQEATRRSVSHLTEDDQQGIRIVVESAASLTAEGVVSGADGGSEKDQMHIVGMHAHAEAHRHGHGHGRSHSHCHPDVHAGASDEEGSPGDSQDPSPDVRHVVVSQILELGIVSHSVIIGLSLGVSHSPCTIRPLIGALAFHQFFEGFALGGCISQAQFQNFAATLMACFFAVTTPLGIAAGAALSSFYNPNSPRALVVEGVFDCVSAGILIYMALVDLIAADFLSQTLSCSRRVQVASYFALFLGAASMSLLAIWA